MPPVIPKPEPTPVIYSHPLYLADLRGVLYVLYLSSSGISDAGSDASNVSQSPAAQMGLGGAWRPLPAGGCGSEHPTCNPPLGRRGVPRELHCAPQKGGAAGGGSRPCPNLWGVGCEQRDLRPQLASCALRGSSGPSFSKCINSHVALSEMLYEVTWRGTLPLISAMI